MEHAIRARGLSKTYRIYHDASGWVLDKLRWGVEPRYRAVPALTDVSLDVPRGACFGVVGANGSGKSTFLKLLAGTSYPSAGTLSVRGRVASLLELGTGFHPLFTGRENVMVNGATLGMTRKEILRKLDEIIEFSELGDFIDVPLRTYSAGMVCRLAFATATATDPDVLVVDEVLAVGDLHFQQKCAARIAHFKARGRTIVVASHSLYHVRQMCDEAMWLKSGRAERVGDAVSVTNDYATYENQLGQRERDLPFPAAADTAADLPHIVATDLIDPATGTERNVFRPNESLGVRVRVRNGSPPRPLAVGVTFSRQEGLLCFAHTTEFDGLRCEFLQGTVTLVLPQLKLLAGEYVVEALLLDEAGVHKFHETPTRSNLIIENRTKDLGLFLQDHDWRIESLDGEPG